MAYSERTDLDNCWGTANVTAWAKLSDSDDSTAIATRVTAAIAFADAYIDSVLRTTGYKVPVQTDAGAVPTLIENLSAVLAGVWLYEATGAKDIDPRTGQAVHRLTFRKTAAEQMLEGIRVGRLKLDQAMAY